MLLAAVLFLAGGVCGAGLTLMLAVQHIQHVIQNPDQAPAAIAGHLSQRLGLNEAQRTQVEEILARHQRVLQGIRYRVQPQVVAELDAVRNDVDTVLTPSQRDAWHRLFARMEHHWIPPLPAPPVPQTTKPDDGRL